MRMSILKGIPEHAPVLIASALRVYGYVKCKQLKGLFPILLLWLLLVLYIRVQLLRRIPRAINLNVIILKSRDLFSFAA